MTLLERVPRSILDMTDARLHIISREAAMALNETGLSREDLKKIQREEKEINLQLILLVPAVKDQYVVSTAKGVYDVDRSKAKTVDLDPPVTVTLSYDTEDGYFGHYFRLLSFAKFEGQSEYEPGEGEYWIVRRLL